MASATQSQSLIDAILPTARGLLVKEIARTNPETAAKRTTRSNAEATKSFDATAYADDILNIFFTDIDCDAYVPMLAPVADSFPFRSALQMTYVDGYADYTNLVKIDPEGVGLDYGPHFQHYPRIRVDAKELVLSVRRIIVEGFPEKKSKLMVLWQRMACITQAAQDGRAIVETMAVNGQFDLYGDEAGDPAPLSPLAEFRKRMAATPSILRSRALALHEDPLLVSYEWLTMAYVVLDALDKARERKLVELREAKEGEKAAKEGEKPATDVKLAKSGTKAVPVQPSKKRSK